jgi:hypothetical protein
MNPASIGSCSIVGLDWKQVEIYVQPPCTNDKLFAWNTYLFRRCIRSCVHYCYWRNRQCNFIISVNDSWCIEFPSQSRLKIRLLLNWKRWVPIKSLKAVLAERVSCWESAKFVKFKGNTIYVLLTTVNRYVTPDAWPSAQWFGTLECSGLRNKHMSTRCDWTTHVSRTIWITTNGSKYSKTFECCTNQMAVGNADDRSWKECGSRALFFCGK